MAQMLGLKRDLGPLQVYATIIGTLIGAGIFVVTGKMGEIAGPAVPIVYILLAPVILTTALAYAIFMSTPLGRSPGGAYMHISRTFRNLYFGYIMMWLKWIAFIGAVGVLSVSFAEYLKFFFPGLNSVVVASVILIFFYVINLVGVRIYGWVETVMFLILLVSILVLVVPGLFTVNLEYYKPLLPYGWGGVLKAMAPIFFAYAGFEAIAQLGGETKDSEKTLPKIFILGVSASVIIYFFMSFVAFGNVPYLELAKSDMAMAVVAGKYLPFGAAGIVAIGALMAFTCSINSGLLVPPRILYAFAKDYITPHILVQVNERFRTPHINLTITAVVALILIWTKSLWVMLDIALQAMFILYFFHSLAMVALPFVNKELWESARVKLPVPLVVIFGLISMAFMAYFTAGMIAGVIDLFVIWIIVGTALYVYSVWKGKQEGIDYSKIVTTWETE
jgi:amino acid transporter